MSLLGRPFSDIYVPTTSKQYGVNVVEQHAGNKKTLVLREIPEDGVKKHLSNKESLAACDVGIFVYDSSSEYSLRRASELLVDVTKQGEETGFSMPCLLVAAKHDLGSYPLAMKESEKICQDMGIDEPIHVSVKESDLNNVFYKIVNAAEKPHLSVPETDAGRNRKRCRQLVNRSLIFVSVHMPFSFTLQCKIACYYSLQQEIAVGAATAFVGMAAYRAYATRKNRTS